MKDKTIENSNIDEFYDVLFNNDLIVVQKDWADKLAHTQVLYVFNTVEDEDPIYGVFREVTSEGTSYWKESY